MKFILNILFQYILLTLKNKICYINNFYKLALVIKIIFYHLILSIKLITIIFVMRIN